MAKKTKKTDALAVPINSEAIVVKTREVAALTKPEDLKDLARRTMVYNQAVKFFKGSKLPDKRAKLLEAAAMLLRTEIQTGSILQEIAKGNDVTDTTYTTFLNENMITTSQAFRWRDMGYGVTKRLKLKSILDESLKFTPAFFEKFEAYVADCGADPSGIAVPSFNGFVKYLHETNAVREKRHRLQVLTAFCANMPFLEAEAFYNRIRTSEHLDVSYPQELFKDATEAFDTLVWKEILDKRNLFFGQAAEMNRRDKAKQDAI